MTGMDMLLASLTPEQLVERAKADVVETNEAMAWSEAFFEATMRWLIEDLEKRTRE
jgi:hypothetical protein